MGPEGRTWLVGVISGVVGALVCGGVLIAAGAVNQPAPVFVTNKTASHPPSSGAGGGDANAIGILGSVAPSVVGLSVNGAQGVASGSGVIVSTDGADCYILTDSALFSTAGSNPQVQVLSYWGQQKTGLLVGTDASAGLSVVRVVMGSLDPPDPAIPGSVADVQTGATIYSVGSGGAAGSSNGSEFATGSIDDSMSYLQPVEGSGAMYSMLVADMSVDPSAYGGAVVDSSGALIGIATEVASQLARPGLTYVTPIDTAMADMYGLIKAGGQTDVHPWLGILQATDISGPGAQDLGVAGAIEVESVAVGSPAAKARIADNDVITAVDGHPAASVGALIAWLALAKPGEVVSVDWLHTGHRKQADITLGTQPATADPG